MLLPAWIQTKLEEPWMELGKRSDAQHIGDSALRALGARFPRLESTARLNAIALLAVYLPTLGGDADEPRRDALEAVRKAVADVPLSDDDDWAKVICAAIGSGARDSIDVKAVIEAQPAVGETLTALHEKATEDAPAVTDGRFRPLEEVLLSPALLAQLGAPNSGSAVSHKHFVLRNADVSSPELAPVNGSASSQVAAAKPAGPRSMMRPALPSRAGMGPAGKSSLASGAGFAMLAAGFGGFGAKQTKPVGTMRMGAGKAAPVPAAARRGAMFIGMDSTNAEKMRQQREAEAAAKTAREAEEEKARKVKERELQIQKQKELEQACKDKKARDKQAERDAIRAKKEAAEKAAKEAKQAERDAARARKEAEKQAERKAKEEERQRARDAKRKATEAASAALEPPAKRQHTGGDPGPSKQSHLAMLLQQKLREEDEQVAAGALAAMRAKPPTNGAQVVVGQ